MLQFLLFSVLLENHTKIEGSPKCIDFRRSQRKTYQTFSQSYFAIQPSNYGLLSEKCDAVVQQTNARIGKTAFKQPTPLTKEHMHHALIFSREIRAFVLFFRCWCCVGSFRKNVHFPFISQQKKVLTLIVFVCKWLNIQKCYWMFSIGHPFSQKRRNSEIQAVNVKEREMDSTGRAKTRPTISELLKFCFKLPFWSLVLLLAMYRIQIVIVFSFLMGRNDLWFLWLVHCIRHIVRPTSYTNVRKHTHTLHIAHIVRYINIRLLCWFIAHFFSHINVSFFPGVWIQFFCINPHNEWAADSKTVQLN